MIAAARTQFNRRILTVFIQQFTPSVQTIEIQRAIRYGCLNRAARFMFVSTIPEFAERGELGDFGEQGIDAEGCVADL